MGYILFMSERIQIVGRGNVAMHLKNALEPLCEVEIINPHTLNNFDTECKITIISVTDDAIESVASRIAQVSAGGVKSGIMCHTSGSKSIEILSSYTQHPGVFYPMQTFSKNVMLNYQDIPFFIEGDCKETEKTICSLARLISSKVTVCDSESRKVMHIAAVFCCNFPNFLYSVAADLLTHRGLDFSVMLPLIEQTTSKIIAGNKPATVQTGPAVRKDRKTIKSHLDYLKKYEPEYSELYNILTESIIKSV